MYYQNRNSIGVSRIGHCSGALARIEKEDRVNAVSKAAFSVRAAVNVADVPAKFLGGSTS